MNLLAKLSTGGTIKFLLVLTLTLSLFSCNVQKRRYQKGYYVHWQKKQKQELPQATIATDSPEALITLTVAEKTPSTEQKETSQLLAAAGTDDAPVIQKRKSTPALLQQCDEIIFKDGTEIKAVITEVTETEVKYKKCDHTDGPLYIAKVSEVFMIKYSHGMRRVFSESKAPERSVSAGTPQEKRVHPMAILALVFGALGLFYGITSIPAIIIGAIALKEIRRNPEKYSGRGLAIAGLVMGIVVVAIFLLVLMLLLAFLL